MYIYNINVTQCWMCKQPQIPDLCLWHLTLFGLKIKTNYCHRINTLELIISYNAPGCYQGSCHDVTCWLPTIDQGLFLWTVTRIRVKFKCKLCFIIFHLVPPSCQKTTASLDPRTDVENFHKLWVKVMQTSRKSIALCKWTWLRTVA